MPGAIETEPERPKERPRDREPEREREERESKGGHMTHTPPANTLTERERMEKKSGNRERKKE